MARLALPGYAWVSTNGRAMPRGSAGVRWSPVARSQEAAQGLLAAGSLATNGEDFRALRIAPHGARTPTTRREQMS